MSFLVELTHSPIDRFKAGNPTHCSDFNSLSKHLSSSPEAFNLCPDDGISNSNVCTDPIKTRAPADISYSVVPWKDIVIYILVQSKVVQTHSLLHWLQSFPEGEALTLAFVADHCAEEPCNDHVSALAAQVETAHKNRLKLTVRVVRALKDIDYGPARVACKALTGVRRLYEAFSDKKYFFKMNEDTVLFPQRLQQFLSTLHSVARADTDPLYFGSILHLFRGHTLCEDMGLEDNGSGNPTYPNKRGWLAGEPTCHAQGEAYGFNQVAMRFLANVTLCTHGMDLESMQEDVYFGWKLYRDLKVVPIHCGSFRPHGLSETVRAAKEHPSSLDLSVGSLISIGEFHKRIY